MQNARRDSLLICSSVKCSTTVVFDSNQIELITGNVEWSPSTYLWHYLPINHTISHEPIFGELYTTKRMLFLTL